MNALVSPADEHARGICTEVTEIVVDERRAFVERECGDDAELADEVLALLDVPQGGADVIDEIVEEAKADEANVAGRRLGPYRLIRPIGRGGMATVWVARRHAEKKEDERIVAVKAILADLAEEEDFVKILRDMDLNTGSRRRKKRSTACVTYSPICEAMPASSRRWR